MSNIRVDVAVGLFDGQTITFKSPADCSQVTGLMVYYPSASGTKSKQFNFADCHGSNIGHLDLFSANAIVKVVLDTDDGLAFVQNADTNNYLEGKLNEKFSPDNKPTPKDIQGLNTETLNITYEDGTTRALEVYVK